MKRPKLQSIRKQSTAGAAAILLASLSGPAAGTKAQAQSAAPASPAHSATAASQFACNKSALSPTERAIQQRMTRRLIAARTAVVEYPKGYEFQYRPPEITLIELAVWVANESKCCPFFDFHIDVEGHGKLLCLRLTGEEGIKDLIRGEFNVPPPQK